MTFKLIIPLQEFYFIFSKYEKSGKLIKLQRKPNFFFYKNFHVKYLYELYISVRLTQVTTIICHHIKKRKKERKYKNM